MLIQSALLDGTMSDGLAYGCQVAKKQCLEEGIFTVKEALAMCMPEYSKNIIEILEPLQSEDNGLSSKWKVLECQELPSYALVDHQIDPTTAHQSSRERAEITVNLAKSFMNSSLERAFKKEDREEKLGRFWKKVLKVPRPICSTLRRRPPKSRMPQVSGPLQAAPSLGAPIH